MSLRKSFQNQIPLDVTEGRTGRDGGATNWKSVREAIGVPLRDTLQTMPTCPSSEHNKMVNNLLTSAGSYCVAVLIGGLTETSMMVMMLMPPTSNETAATATKRMPRMMFKAKPARKIVRARTVKAAKDAV